MSTDNPTPTPLASTAMEAALYADLCDHVFRKFGCLPINADQESVALIQKHFQPLLAKVEGERDDALRDKRSFFDKMNQINQWYAELIDVVYGELPEGINERPDPRTFIKARYDELATLRADLAAKEAALEQAFVAMDGAAFYFEKRNTGMRGQGICAKLKEAMHTIKYPPDSALASRADKGGAR